MTALSTLVPALKREVAVPGEFDTFFPESDDALLTASLADGFAEAQLDGWFGEVTLDTGTNVVTPDLSTAGGALVVIYAGTRIIRAQLRNLNSSERYRAGSAEYEIARAAASVLKAELDALYARKKDLLAQARTGSRTAYVFEGYLGSASVDWVETGNFYDYEMV